MTWFALWLCLGPQPERIGDLTIEAINRIPQCNAMWEGSPRTGITIPGPFSMTFTRPVSTKEWRSIRCANDRDPPPCQERPMS